jgi:monovalent cation/hydrogen antiporter
VAVLASSLVTRHWRVAPPILLLAAGALLGFAPALRGVSLPPEVVLLLFLPALLYWESLTTSLREIRSNLRVIVLLSTGLVIATAAAVAAGAHEVGLPWGRPGCSARPWRPPTRPRSASWPGCCRRARSPSSGRRAW